MKSIQVSIPGQSVMWRKVELRSEEAKGRYPVPSGKTSLPSDKLAF
jgi:hypothetical protein